VKRLELSKGLAVSAVGALAVTGLALAVPVGPASAAGPDVVLLSQLNATNDTSLRVDGTVTLTAMRINPAATVTFQYNTNPNAVDGSAGWTTAPGSPGGVGPYTVQVWTPDPSLSGVTVAIRAVAVVGGSTTYSTRQGVTIYGASSGPEAAAIQTSSLGFFDQPYASTGRTATRASMLALTSATGGAGQLSVWNPATQAFQGTVHAQVEAYDIKIGPGNYVEGGRYYGDLDLTAFDADAGEYVAVSAEVDTDEVRPMSLYAQTVTSVVAQAPTLPAGQPAPVLVTVYDQSSSPIAGAEVRRADLSLVGYTDGAGRVRDVGISGSFTSYYANATDTDAMDGADVSSSVSTYGPSPDYVQAVALDGREFDDDEYTAGDLTLQVDDATRTPVGAGVPVNFRIYPSGSTPPATFQTANTNAQGRVTVPFDPAGPDGQYTVDFDIGGDSRAFRFTAGDSTLSLSPAAGASSPGGQIGYTGTLVVAGRPLEGRRVQIGYKRGIELVPGTTADAGLGTSRALSLTVGTDHTGAFAFLVDDAAEKPQAAETGGKLTLSTLPATGGTLSGNANETGSGTTAFGSKKGKAKVKLKGSDAGNKDKLVVKGPDSVAGEKVKFYRVVNGKLERIKTKKLGKKGDTVLKVTDSNGNGVTTYVVKLLSSDRVKGSKSKKLKLG